MRRRGLLVVVSVLATALGPMSVPPVAAASASAIGPVPWRLSGPDRFATAGRIAEETAAPGGTVYVATGATYPDALAAGPVAAAVGAAILLVTRDTVPAATSSALDALAPTEIVVVGGRSAVSDAVLAALDARSAGTAVRVAGEDRYATAAALSRSRFVPGLPDVYVATGENYPDALAGGAVAAAVGAPILLVRRDAVPTATASELARLRPSRNVVVLGGSAAVSQGVAAQLQQYAPVLRLSGSDRYATALAVARHGYPGSAERVVVATGTAFPDALAGAPAAASLGAPLLLVPGACVPDPVASEIAGLGARTLVVLGGTSAVRAGVEHVRACPDRLPDVSEGFEDGATGWELEAPIWSVTTTGSGHVLTGEGHGFARLTGVIAAPSRVSLRVLLGGEGVEGGGLHVNLNETTAGEHTRFFVGLHPTSVGITVQQGATFDALGERPASLSAGVWHDVDVLSGGGSLDVLVDGVPVLGADAPSLPPGDVSLEVLDQSVSVDDLEVDTATEATPHVHAPRAVSELPPGPDVSGFVNGVHSGDLTLTGTQRLVLSGGRYTMRAGWLNLRDDAELVIEADAALEFDREASPLIHWGIHANQRATIIVRGEYTAAPGSLAVMHVADQATAVFENTIVSGEHVGTVNGDATVEIRGSRLVSSIGGGFDLGGSGTLSVVDSEIGYVGLGVPSGSRLHVDGLRSGYSGDFDLQRDADTTLGYQVVLDNVLVTPDTLGEGPFERGWMVAPDETADVEVRDSVLRKVRYELPAGGPDSQFSGLRLGTPSDLTVGSVVLADVTVTGQWGFFVHGARNLTFTDCDGLWFFLYDQSDVTLIRSTMNEYDPRNHTGTLTFVDSEWRVAGEIIDNNDERIEGTVTIGSEVRDSLSWENSRVTRAVPVLVRDAAGQPRAGVTVTAARSGTTVSATTDAAGRATLDLVFTDADYLSPWQVSTPATTAVPVDFFASTPVRIVG